MHNIHKSQNSPKLSMLETSYSFSFYLVVVLSCFHNLRYLHIVKIKYQLCLDALVSLLLIEMQMCIMAWSSGTQLEKRRLQDIYHHASPNKIIIKIFIIMVPQTLASRWNKWRTNGFSPAQPPSIPSTPFLHFFQPFPTSFVHLPFPPPSIDTRFPSHYHDSWAVLKNLLTNILTFCILNLTVWELIRTWYPAFTTKPLLTVDANVVLSSWCQK